MPPCPAVSIPGVPGLSEYNLDIHELDQVVQRLYRAGLSASSHKTYQVAQRRYLAFCTDFSLNALPTSENLLCYFVACLGQQGLAHSSIQTYLSGIRQLQISHGWNDPEINKMPRLRQVMRGLKIERGKQGQGPRARLPITPFILRKMRQSWVDQDKSFNSVMLWAASLTTFFSFCRCGLLVRDIQDLLSENPHSSHNFRIFFIYSALSKVFK